MTYREWPSESRHCNRIRRSSVQCQLGVLARLSDPTLIQRYQRPSGPKLIKRSDKHWVSEVVPSITAQRWLMGTRIVDKKVICKLNSKVTFYESRHFKLALIFHLEYWIILKIMFCLKCLSLV